MSLYCFWVGYVHLANVSCHVGVISLCYLLSLDPAFEILTDSGAKCLFFTQPMSSCFQFGCQTRNSYTCRYLKKHSSSHRFFKKSWVIEQVKRSWLLAASGLMQLLVIQSLAQGRVRRTLVGLRLSSPVEGRTGWCSMCFPAASGKSSRRDLIWKAQRAKSMMFVTSCHWLSVFLHSFILAKGSCCLKLFYTLYILIFHLTIKLFYKEHSVLCDCSPSHLYRIQAHVRQLLLS